MDMISLIDFSWWILLLFFFNSSVPQGQATFFMSEHSESGLNTCLGQLAFKNTPDHEKVRIQMNCTHKGLGTEERSFSDVFIHFKERNLFWKEIFYSEDKPSDNTTPFTRFALDTSFKDLMLEKFNVRSDKSTHFFVKAISPEKNLYLSYTNKNDVLMRLKNSTLGNLATTLELHSEPKDVMVTFKDYQHVPTSEQFEIPKDYNE